MSELLNGTDFTKIIVQIISAVDMVNIAILWQKLIFFRHHRINLLEVLFPYESACPSVGWLVVWS